ncbi:MAG: flagellar export protein FliJ [Candidatus Goldbacteria bacterium]|nr:flagellar export protein FliJ [Candidatus Goldiibacteriota bacterium]
MKKFQFKFETVLKVKEKKEEKLKKELFKLNTLQIEQHQILEKIKEEKTKTSKEKSGETVTDIQSLIYFEQYLNLLRKRIDDVNKKIQELQEQIDDKREEVITASKEKKTFERLKSHHLDDYNKIIIANEQKVLDEIAVSKYNRKEQHSY